MVAPASYKPVLGVSMGDPGGIGPEVIVKALAERDVRLMAKWRIHGVRSALERAAAAARIEPFWWRVGAGSGLVDTTTAHDVVLVDHEHEPSDTSVHAAGDTKLGGALSFRFVEDAIADAMRTADDPLRTSGLVTGPISKAAWALAGRGKYPGHTELLATRFRAKRSGMMFVTPRLRVILATAHVPLMEVRNVLTIGRIHDAIDLGVEACRSLGVAAPRVAVCGLNPHAGEGGLLGDEDERLIEPAIRVARDQVAASGGEVSGPWPADTIFGKAVEGAFDLVVAMYHDQGLIPVKLLDRDEAVNVTVGLPSVRTSPDHGTAFDIAGRNRAHPGSMASAMRLAARMAVTVEATSTR
ncbi:MAG: 4-hydroxythreonine-4-phosphate dehydrogenase PdxA [Planctomycetota bacterium]